MDETQFLSAHHHHHGAHVHMYSAADVSAIADGPIAAGQAGGGYGPPGAQQQQYYRQSFHRDPNSYHQHSVAYHSAPFAAAATAGGGEANNMTHTSNAATTANAAASNNGQQKGSSNCNITDLGATLAHLRQAARAALDRRDFGTAQHLFGLLIELHPQPTMAHAAAAAAAKRRCRGGGKRQLQSSAVGVITTAASAGIFRNAETAGTTKRHTSTTTRMLTDTISNDDANTQSSGIDGSDGDGEGEDYNGGNIKGVGVAAEAEDAEAIREGYREALEAYNDGIAALRIQRARALLSAGDHAAALHSLAPLTQSVLSENASENPLGAYAAEVAAAEAEQQRRRKAEAEEEEEEVAAASVYQQAKQRRKKKAAASRRAAAAAAVAAAERTGRSNAYGSAGSGAPADSRMPPSPANYTRSHSRQPSAPAAAAVVSPAAEANASSSFGVGIRSGGGVGAGGSSAAAIRRSFVTVLDESGQAILFDEEEEEEEDVSFGDDHNNIIINKSSVHSVSAAAAAVAGSSSMAALSPAAVVEREKEELDVGHDTDADAEITLAGEQQFGGGGISEEAMEGGVGLISFGSGGAPAATAPINHDGHYSANANGSSSSSADATDKEEEEEGEEWRRGGGRGGANRFPVVPAAADPVLASFAAAEGGGSSSPAYANLARIRGAVGVSPSAAATASPMLGLLVPVPDTATTAAAISGCGGAVGSSSTALVLGTATEGGVTVSNTNPSLNPPPPLAASTIEMLMMAVTPYTNRRQRSAIRQRITDCHRNGKKSLATNDGRNSEVSTSVGSSDSDEAAALVGSDTSADLCRRRPRSSDSANNVSVGGYPYNVTGLSTIRREPSRARARARGASVLAAAATSADPSSSSAIAVSATSAAAPPVAAHSSSVCMSPQFGCTQPFFDNSAAGLGLLASEVAAALGAASPPPSAAAAAAALAQAASAAAIALSSSGGCGGGVSHHHQHHSVSRALSISHRRGADGDGEDEDEDEPESVSAAAAGALLPLAAPPTAASNQTFTGATAQSSPASATAHRRRGGCARRRGSHRSQPPRRRLSDSSHGHAAGNTNNIAEDGDGDGDAADVDTEEHSRLCPLPSRGLLLRREAVLIAAEASLAAGALQRCTAYANALLLLAEGEEEALRAVAADCIRRAAAANAHPQLSAPAASAVGGTSFDDAAGSVSQALATTTDTATSAAAAADQRAAAQCLYTAARIEERLAALVATKVAPFFLLAKAAEEAGSPHQAAAHLRSVLSIDPTAVAAMEAIQQRCLLSAAEQVELIMALELPREAEVLRSLYLLKVPATTLPAAGVAGRGGGGACGYQQQHEQYMQQQQHQQQHSTAAAATRGGGGEYYEGAGPCGIGSGCLDGTFFVPGGHDASHGGGGRARSAIGAGIALNTARHAHSLGQASFFGGAGAASASAHSPSFFIPPPANGDNASSPSSARLNNLNGNNNSGYGYGPLPHNAHTSAGGGAPLLDATIDTTGGNLSPIGAAHPPSAYAYASAYADAFPSSAGTVTIPVAAAGDDWLSVSSPHYYRYNSQQQQQQQQLQHYYLAQQQQQQQELHMMRMGQEDEVDVDAASPQPIATSHRRPPAVAEALEDDDDDDDDAHVAAHRNEGGIDAHSRHSVANSNGRAAVATTMSVSQAPSTLRGVSAVQPPTPFHNGADGARQGEAEREEECDDAHQLGNASASAPPPRRQRHHPNSHNHHHHHHDPSSFYYENEGPAYNNMANSMHSANNGAFGAYHPHPHPPPLPFSGLPQPPLQSAAGAEPSVPLVPIDGIPAAAILSRQALLERARGDLKAMRKTCQQLLQIAPSDRQALCLLALALVEEGDHAALFALGHLEQRARPFSATALYAIGCYYYTRGEAERAGHFFAKATEAELLFPEAWIALGHCYAALQEGERARAVYHRATVLFPALAPAAIFLALQQSRAAQTPAAAVAVLERARATVGQHDPLLLNELGTLYFKARHYEEAIGAFLAALDATPSAASLLLSAGGGGGVGSGYSSSSVLPPPPETAGGGGGESGGGDVAPLFNLALAYRRTQQYGPALRYFELYRRCRPRAAHAHTAIGVTYHLAGHLKEAIAAYHVSLAIAPDTFCRQALDRALAEEYASQRHAVPSGVLAAISGNVLTGGGAPSSSSSKDAAAAAAGANADTDAAADEDGTHTATEVPPARQQQAPAAASVLPPPSKQHSLLRKPYQFGGVPQQHGSVAAASSAGPHHRPQPSGPSFLRGGTAAGDPFGHLLFGGVGVGMGMGVGIPFGGSAPRHGSLGSAALYTPGGSVGGTAGWGFAAGGPSSHQQQRQPSTTAFDGVPPRRRRNAGRMEAEAEAEAEANSSAYGHGGMPMAFGGFGGGAREGSTLMVSHGYSVGPRALSMGSSVVGGGGGAGAAAAAVTAAAADMMTSFGAATPHGHAPHYAYPHPHAHHGGGPRSSSGAASLPSAMFAQRALALDTSAGSSIVAASASAPSLSRGAAAVAAPPAFAPPFPSIAAYPYAHHGGGYGHRAAAPSQPPLHHHHHYAHTRGEAAAAAAAGTFSFGGTVPHTTYEPSPDQRLRFTSGSIADGGVPTTATTTAGGGGGGGRYSSVMSAAGVGLGALDGAAALHYGGGGGTFGRPFGTTNTDLGGGYGGGDGGDEPDPAADYHRGAQ